MRSFNGAIRFDLSTNASGVITKFYISLCESLWNERIAHYPEFYGVSSTNFYICKIYSTFLDKNGYEYSSFASKNENMFLFKRNLFLNIEKIYKHTPDAVKLDLFKKELSVFKKFPIYRSLIMPFFKTPLTEKSYQFIVDKAYEINAGFNKASGIIIQNAEIYNSIPTDLFILNRM